jgi:spermidine synthase
VIPRGLKRHSLACGLFFCSGFAALVYETVWTRRLVLVFGATLTSASAVLAGFMAGMALGALWGARLARRAKDPLLLYGKLELGIAACAAAFPWVVKAILGFIETTSLPIGPVRFALIFAALLPATTLMGITFPVLCQLPSGKDAGRSVGDLYAANLIGSCLGVMAAAYVLLPLLGLSGSERLAVAINLVVGFAALSRPRESQPAPAGKTSGGASPWPAFACLFIAGVCGMAFEVVWLRVLMPSFNNSAYGFASVIFVFLLGLGGGSFVAARSPALGFEALGGLQLLAALYAYVGYRLFEIAELVQMRLGTMGPSGISPVVFAPIIETLLILLPLAVLQGMLLPAALRLIAGHGETGADAGRLYFWNTVGGIGGALAAGFWWIPRAGVQNALFLTITISALCGAGLVAWASRWREARWGAPAAALAAPLLMWAALGGMGLPEKVLLEWINRAPGAHDRLLFYADDSEASVAVPDADRHLIINGVGVTGYTNATKMIAHIPLLLHPDPKRVLIICFGMGTTFRSALKHPVDVEVVDLVPSVFETFKYFYPDAARVAADPRARRFVNDGRNHLLRSRGGYDVIIVDPSPPLYAAGTVNLYSRDFFELAGRRLRPGGILAVWLPEYADPDFKMVMKSFISALPHTQMWLATKEKGGILMLGSAAPLPLDRARVSARLKEAGVKADLREFNAEFAREDAFWSLYLGPGESFESSLKASPMITDDFPRLEYPYFRSKTGEYYRHPAILTAR